MSTLAAPKRVKKLNRLNAGDYLMYLFTGLFALFCIVPRVLAVCVSFSS